MSDLKVQVIEHEGEEYAHKSIVIALTNKCDQLESRVKELEEELSEAIEIIEYSGVDYDEVLEGIKGDEL